MGAAWSPNRSATAAAASRTRSFPTCWLRSARRQAVEAGRQDHVDDLLVAVLAAALEELEHRVARPREERVEDRDRREARAHAAVLLRCLDPPAEHVAHGDEPVDVGLVAHQRG